MRTTRPAPGTEEWFIQDSQGVALVGVRCSACGSVSFPPRPLCANPACEADKVEPTRLCSRGVVWAATDARYQPPPPYVPITEPYEPFAIAAVELEEDGIVVLGQVVAGISADALPAGTPMKLVVDRLFSDDDHDYTIWKWKPTEGQDETVPGA